MSEEQGVTIGIDLGTTYSCIAYYNEQGQVQILQNELGDRTTPSYVTYTQEERVVGRASKSMAVKDPLNTIFDVKRLIGCKYNDLGVQSDIAKFPYKVIDINNQPFVEVQYLGETKRFRPEEISSVVLSSLKESAEKAIGKKVSNAVITVPAYFNDSQRQATKDAGRLAGLNVLRIINEPTAAAMAYGLGCNKTDVEANVLVFDLGGGTFDVSLLNIFDGVFQVLATSGDTHLGGEDFDNIIVEHLVAEFKKQSGVDISTDGYALRLLKVEAEQCKRTLSSALNSQILISNLSGGHSFNYKLSRAKFETLCASVFQRCMVPVKRVLDDAKIKASEVNEIVMVGGSSRIPKIQSMLREYFNNKELNLTINPDEAVAYGAAVQGAILSGKANDICVILVDVIPLSLGVETQGGIMDVIIPRQKTIPCKVTKEYSTSSDLQTSVSIKVYEGERASTRDNNCLGTFELSGIPPKPKHMAKICVTFDLDANGILMVSAQEQSTGMTKNITISNNKGRLSEDELKLKLEEADRYKEQDAEISNRIKEANSSESYFLAVKASIDTIIGLTEENKEVLKKICDEGLFWLENSYGDQRTSSDIKAHRLELEGRVSAIYESVSA